jgi:hypothetical protein
MKYALLIYGSEAERVDWTQEQIGEEIQQYAVYEEEVTGRGLRQSGEALLETSKATTVRVRDGKTIMTDGPFAETKEQLGGFFVLECNNLDEALEMAAKIPGAHTGSIEVRPVWEFGE